jgi:CRP/FNR family transcriptional regulator, cyclic AMP receptor protein
MAKEKVELATLVQVSSFLRQVPLFDALGPRELGKLADIVEPVSFYAGERLFQQGDPGDALYVVRKGAVSVRVDQTEIAILREREVFGEMALIEGEPRSATCVVVADSILLRVRATDFALLLSMQPELAIALMRMLALRLRRVHRKVAEERLTVQPLLSSD